jgi:nucleotide-binding universal stress UspA family protein
MKSVLLHVQNDEDLDAKLQAALAIVRASNGHLSCLHVTPLNAYVAFDGFGGPFIMSGVLDALQENESKMRARIEGHLAHEDVSWDYAQVTGEPTHAIVSKSALADLIVLGRSHHVGTNAYPGISLLGDVLAAARSSILVQPSKQNNFDPLGPALVAWNGSFEAANAMRFALPMLAMASVVHIVSIEGDTEYDFPSVSASEYLSRHGITSELHLQKADKKSIADALISAAALLNASYVVMGGYGHSRVREYLFGGVTRHMLLHSPVPIFISR